MKRSMMQVYLKNSQQAVQTYQKAFGAELKVSHKNEDGTYLHAELMIGDQVLALSECDDVKVGNTMQFCFHYGPGHEETIKTAYEVLKEGADIHHELGETFYSPLMMSLTDRYGVSWCLFI